MLIWVLAIVLFGGFAVSGYYKGAIRMLVSLVGFLLGAFLAVPLGRLLTPLWPKMGLEHPIWNTFWGPLAVFFLFVGVFVGISFYVHRLVDLHFKYSSDDFGYLQWQRMNQDLGLCIGPLIGGAHLLLILLVVHVFGYMTVQLSPEDGASFPVRVLNNLRTGLASSGLDRLVQRMDPMPDRYYQSADIFGLLYHNPGLQARLVDYPPYLSMSDRPEILEVAEDADFKGMLTGQSDTLALLNHPRTQTLVANQELMDAILGVDLVDLKKYLETGVSPKYADQKILGRWRLDRRTTFMRERKRRPDMPAPEVRALRQLVALIAPNTTVRVTPDNQLTLKVDLNDQVRQSIRVLVEGQPPAPTNQPPAEELGGMPPQMDPAVAARYGLGRGGRGGGGGRPQIPIPVVTAPAPKPAPAKPAMLQPFPLATLQGKWQLDGPSYVVEATDDKGKPVKWQATAEEDVLVLNLGGPTLVFTRLVM